MDDGPPVPDRDLPSPDRDVPSIRASDSEREATVQLLQQSYAEGRLTLAEFDDRTTSAYGARFQSDLAELTRDLSPAHSPAHPPAHQGDGFRPVQHTASTPARRVTGGSGPGTSIAVMSGVERTGAWTLPAEHTTVAVMGGVEIDLRAADLQARETTIRAFALWGGIEIYVPDDIHVHVEGIGLMGAFSEASANDDDHRPVRQPAPGAPVIRVVGLALMAGIEVRRVPRPAER